METQRIVVMRHGRRADRDGEIWEEQATRSWDPPLSELGKQDVGHFAEKINDFISPNFKIFSSPFRRCIETAKIIQISTKKCNEDGTSRKACSNLTVDLALSEIYDYLNLIRYVNSIDMASDTGFAGMEDWFCKSRIMNVAKNGTKHARLIGDASLLDVISSYLDKETLADLKIVGRFPQFERWVSLPFHINQRYCDVFQNIADEIDTDALVITHLAALNSILNHFYGYLHYFYIKPGGFIIFERSKCSDSAEWGPWQLIQNRVQKVSQISSNH